MEEDDRVSMLVDGWNDQGTDEILSERHLVIEAVSAGGDTWAALIMLGRRQQ